MSTIDPLQMLRDIAISNSNECMHKHIDNLAHVIAAEIEHLRSLQAEKKAADVKDQDHG